MNSNKYLNQKVSKMNVDLLVLRLQEPGIMESENQLVVMKRKNNISNCVCYIFKKQCVFLFCKS